MRLCLFRITFEVLSGQCHTFVSSVSFSFTWMRFDLWVCFFRVFRGTWHCWFRIHVFWVALLSFVFGLNKALLRLIGCFWGFAFGSGAISKNLLWYFRFILSFRFPSCSSLRGGQIFRPKVCWAKVHGWHFWFRFPWGGPRVTWMSFSGNLNFAFWGAGCHLGRFLAKTWGNWPFRWEWHFNQGAEYCAWVQVRA